MCREASDRAYTRMYQKCLSVFYCVCVCLTKFVSVFSSSADSASQHLDVFAAGAAVELVDPVVSPTHGVSHLRLVLHMHTEVDPIHTKYLLCSHTQIQIQRVMNRLEKLHIYNLSFIMFDRSLPCMQTLTCNGLHITSNIWIHLEKVETDDFRNM